MAGLFVQKMVSLPYTLNTMFALRRGKLIFYPIMQKLKKPKRKMAIFLLTTEPTHSYKYMLMTRTAVFLCTLLFILTRTFSQEDSTQVLKKFLPLQIASIDAKVV